MSNIFTICIRTDRLEQKSADPEEMPKNVVSSVSTLLPFI